MIYIKNINHLSMTVSEYVCDCISLKKIRKIIEPHSRATHLILFVAAASLVYVSDKLEIH